MSLARACISGTLVGEPEKRRTPNDYTVTNFTIRVQPANRNESPFMVRVTCWRNLAEVAAEQLHKDVEVTVEGRLQVHQYEGPGGIPKRNYEIDATNIYVGRIQPLGFAGDTASSAGFRSQPAGAAPASQRDPFSATRQPVTAGTSGSGDALPQEDLLTEDDIPF